MRYFDWNKLVDKKKKNFHEILVCDAPRLHGSYKMVKLLLIITPLPIHVPHPFLTKQYFLKNQQ